MKYDNERHQLIQETIPQKRQDVEEAKKKRENAQENEIKRADIEITRAEGKVHFFISHIFSPF